VPSSPTGVDQRGIEDTVLVFPAGEGRALAHSLQIPGGRSRSRHCMAIFLAPAAAIRPARHQGGKVVWPSSIAEKLLTIAGVRLVIDSGLTRRNCFQSHATWQCEAGHTGESGLSHPATGRAGRPALAAA